LASSVSSSRFLELHQLDTFYNALNPNDQDALDSATGGNFLDKIPRECLSIIEREAKAITTRSGMSYKEPPIPPPGMDQQKPIEVTTDTELPSPKDIQPLLQKEKLREKNDILAAKFMEIFRDLHFELSFADALVHMPKFAPMFKKLLNNKDKLIQLTKTPLNENYSAVNLLTEQSPNPQVLLRTFFVKVGKFYFPADFVVLDSIADPRVPLILGRPFLSTAYAIINVYEREIIIRQNQQSLTIQCSDIPSVKKVEQINKIDFINARGIDFESEEIKDFLNNDSIPFGVEDSQFNMDEYILFLEKSSTKNLIPIPNECVIVSENGSQSTEPINDNSSDSTIISNPLFDNDKINFDEINSHVEFNSDEFTSNHDIEKNYINRMEMLFTINPLPHNPTNNNINVESFSSFSIPNQESEPHQEEIDVFSITNDVLPPSDDDLDEEVDAVGDLHVDNVIQNSEHEYSESEDSNFDNPLLPLPPPEPPDKEFDFEIDFEKEILVVRNAIAKFEYINARVKFDD
nr:hypothetical protein [Tanacetum cinerariifolium]